MQLIMRYVRPYMRTVVGGMICKFLGTIMDLLLPWLLTHVLKNIVPLNNVGAVYLWGGIMLLASVLALVGNVYANRVAASVARDATRSLRHDLFGQITHLTSREIDRFTIPSLISRMTTDTYYVYRMIGMIQRIGIRAPILLIGGILFTMLQDTVLASLLLAILPFMALIVWYISKKGVPLYTKLQENVDSLTRIVRENLSGIRIIKALSKTEDEKRRYNAVNEEVARSETKAASIMAINGPLMQLLLNAGLVLVVLVGARRVDADLAASADLISFLQYFTIILNAMLTITRILTMYSKALASSRRIDEVLEGEVEQSLPLSTDDAKAQPGAAHIVFDHVTFSYNKKVPNVEDITFTLQHGQHLGILGATGAGKSTLIKLLLRLYDVDTGVIRINGQDVRNLPLGELRRMFGVVFQNDAIFRGNVEDNVRLGREVSLDEINAALQDAQAAMFVEEKGGLQAAVASRGQNFSGGQQQRLLLARAMAGTPDILILDDAASALDFKTESNLRAALRNHYQDTTCITIAQRISAVMHCDLVIVLEEGKIHGIGTHEQLLQSCELYREIATLQIGGED